MLDYRAIGCFTDIQNMVFTNYILQYIIQIGLTMVTLSNIRVTTSERGANY